MNYSIFEKLCIYFLIPIIFVSACQFADSMPIQINPDINESKQIAEGKRLKGEDKRIIMYVKGIIKIKSSGKVLKVGSQIKFGEQLFFETPNALADTFSLSKGREVLKKPEHKIGSDLYFELFEIYFSPAENNTLTSRGYITNILSLKNHFSNENKPFAYLVLGGIRELKISHSAFPMSDTTFFYVRYDYHSKLINKKLDFREDTLIISKKTLFTINSKAVDIGYVSNFNLYYYDKTKQTSEFITRFDPKFPKDYKLEKQLGVMVEISKNGGKSDKYIIETAKIFLYQRYGHYSEYNFSNWFCKHFRICDIKNGSAPKE